VVKLVLKRHEVQKTDFTRKVCPPGVNSGVVCKSSVVRSDLWITTGTGGKKSRKLENPWETRSRRTLLCIPDLFKSSPPLRAAACSLITLPSGSRH
jgi:hypothetical protein